MPSADLDVERPHLGPYVMVGNARLYRVGAWGFPVYRLVQGDDSLALLGRGNWFTVNFGRGQRIELPNGDAWRLRSIGLGGTFVPMVVDGVGRRVATAGTSEGSYGINVRDYGCVLYPDDEGIGRANRWILGRHDDVLATFTRHPMTVHARLPTHLGAVLLAFELIRHGLAEESMPVIPAFRWGR